MDVIEDLYPRYRIATLGILYMGVVEIQGEQPLLAAKVSIF